MKLHAPLFVGVSALTLLAAQAQAAAPTVAAPAAAADDSGGVNLQELVVTASARPEKKIDTSVSVSSVGAQTIQQIAPQSAADLVRSIPGIRSEASGGEGNANIAVRGLPVASGGAKFVQFQEDGLPVLNFGDIAFGTADTFVKADYNIDRVELVRGGSASTAASNAPGAVINFISKTGQTDGGAVGITEGLDFGRTRFDADYGGHLGNGWRFHVGGFYDFGTGPKTVGYQAENGGQIKANLTKEFDKGFVRFDLKLLDDRSPAWLPVPVGATVNGNTLSFASLPGFSIQNGALQTPSLQTITSYDQNGNRETNNLDDGYHSVTKAFGGEVNYDLGWGVKFDDKFRFAFNSGDFVGPYPGNVDTAANIAASIGGEGASLVNATTGAAYTGYAVNMVLFNTKLNNFDNYSNQLNLSKTFDGGAYGSGAVTLGYFLSQQNLSMDWHWNDYVLGAQGQNAPLLNVVNAAGKALTAGGLVAYAPEAFGATCCEQNYDLKYTINAPSLNLNWKVQHLDLDASVRYDIQHAGGTYAGASATGPSLNLDQGLISDIVPLVDFANETRVNYTKRYWSYSVGANYEIDPDLALFARVSRGARFNADRVASLATNGVVPDYAALNFVDQQEGGVKFLTRYLAGALTVFHSTTAEQNTNITPQGITVISRDYRAYGVELEANAHYSLFSLYGGITYTNARITADAITPADIGQAPQRQADWVWQLRPTVSWKALDVGANIIGTSGSVANDGSPLIQPGYVVVGAFAAYDINHRIEVQLHVDNLFNVVGITEVDQGPNAAGVGSARSILGRQVSAGVKYRF
jgi:outer membrane receptor protein involved in Fe transport